MASHRPGSIHTSGRIGRPFRVEYINRSGEQVNPHTGKPYARPNGIQSTSAKIRGVKKSLPIKRSGVLFGRLKLIPTDANLDPPPRACFNCWQPGHRRSKCTRPVLTRFCNNCGRRNEDVRTCPRCADAHKLWLEVQRAKERGEKINERLLLPTIENDDYDVEDDDNNVMAEEVEEINDPDAILQELIYQDQRTRELLEYEERKREQREALNAIYRNSKRLSEKGAVAARSPSYVNALVYKKIPSSSVAAYVNEVDNEYQLLEHDPLIDGDVHDNKRGSSFLDQRNPSPQERHIGMAVFNEREVVSPTRYLGYADHVLNRKEERAETPEPARTDGNWRQVMADASLVSPDSDPVQDILLLAKTISHLSPETQDLVMRQVIAERQEQTKRRAVTQDRPGSRYIETVRF
ncbi:uncharacterized protein LOC106647762 [Copidosoma floridanum]|uniref:uncharacterized protein LOC106647762 n=1 Tax=Copidosoma floridanum TaxID=29053 RepID=UPI0006C9B279|nr:uncharacterized protein LOC106647762 [Copidosoma floridanum]